MKARPVHGTRAYYVRFKCRCDMCRRANRLYYHHRQAALAAEIEKGIADRLTTSVVSPASQTWTPPGKETRTRVYKRACPGVDGQPCKWKTHLRKDSKGGICLNCRELLVRADTVPAKRVIEHLVFLRKSGVGLRTVAKKSGVSYSTLQDLANRGKKTLLRATANRIFSVREGTRAGGHMVDGARTWSLIQEMKNRAKMTNSEITARLGHTSWGLQLKREKVRYRTEQQVIALHEQVMRELREDYVSPATPVLLKIERILEETDWTRKELAKKLGWPHLKLRVIEGKVHRQVAGEVRKVYDEEVTSSYQTPTYEVCSDCGFDHSKTARVAFVRARLPSTFSDLREMRSCYYGGHNGERRLYRDLASAGAVQMPGEKNGGGLWHPGKKTPILPSSEEDLAAAS